MPRQALKLLLAASDMATAQGALAAMAGRPRSVRATLTSIYYDTPDQALRRNDLVLRVRKHGSRFVQTVRANGSDGDDRDAREEWEDTIAGAQPDLGAPASGGHLVAALAARSLRPLFTTRVQRTAFELRPKPGTRLAVALDRGAIQLVDADAPAVPIQEIALTLTAGDPVVLWDVALRLLDIVPFRIGAASQAERGYRLVGGTDEKPPVAHARPLPLDGKMLLDTALQCAGRRYIALLRANEAAVLERHPEAIHQMRVAVRRLRAVLAAVRPMLPGEHFRWADDELKWLGKAFAAARGWDVFAHGLLVPVSGALAGEREIARLATIAERHRHNAYDRARETIEAPRYTATLLRLSRWFEARGWRDQPVSEASARLVAPLGKVAPALLTRLYRKTRRRMRHFATQTPPERHRLRIALKKLHYGIDFLAPLFDRRAVKRFIATVKPLQDDLGHSNDVRAAHALVADLKSGESAAIERAGGIVLGWHDRGLAEAEAATMRHLRRFRRADPFW